MMISLLVRSFNDYLSSGTTHEEMLLVLRATGQDAATVSSYRSPFQGELCVVIDFASPSLPLAFSPNFWQNAISRP